MQQNVYFLALFLMKCQDETVSTMECTCHHISLYEYKTEHAPSSLGLETWSPLVD